MNIIDTLQSHPIKQILESYQLKHVWLTGSYVYQKNTPESDIDIVYETEKSLSLLELGWLSYKLQKLLWTYVDLINKKKIRKGYEELLTTMIPIY